MGTMEVARSNGLNKTVTLSTITRNTSCNRGWLRMGIQTTFAVITVSSFILIVIMAIQNPASGVTPNLKTKCQINNYCMVICNEVPYFGKYEEDIISAIVGGQDKCSRISLTLNNPRFINSTLPPNWLSNLRVSVQDLSIFRGNLMHIAPGAFMSQSIGGIRRMQFAAITIRTWEEESLVGLSRLEELTIKECNIVRIQKHALRPLDDTLETLTIIKSNIWNPKNVTGTVDFTKLTLVDFSFNYFNNILGRDSFAGLKNCKILYINSCRITAIGDGAFDYLHSVELIFLNDNLLMTVPSGLFDNILLLSQKPRININGNLWLCDCSYKGLRDLITNDLLVFDPICHYPEDIRGMTFSRFEHYCNNKTEISNETYSGNYVVKSDDSYEYIYINGSCCNDNTDSTNVSFRLHSPILHYKCYLNEMKHLDIFSFPGQINGRDILTSSNWLKVNFFIESGEYSVVQIDASGTSGYGLLWFHSKCQNEIYCVEILPNFLRVYNVDESARYTFCPFKIKTGLINVENCIGYDISLIKSKIPQTYFAFQILLYISTGLICLILGAFCVYWIIRIHPWLLKGSKRIVFVKHKMVDALVLPPKVPLRSDLINDSTTCVENKKIFIVSGNNLKCNNLSPNKYHTQKSVRSEISGTPSYVSALQPTEEQLAEWRINNHFNNDLTVTSNSELSILSWIYSNESLYYAAELENSKIYESL